MNKSFKGEYIPFYIRLLKRLAPVILLLLFTFMKISRNQAFAEIQIYFYVAGVICFIIGIFYHTDKIRTIVNEIQITDNKLQIIGQDFNSRYEDTLDLNKTRLEIQLEELGKNKTRYCLEIYCDDKYYYLNKFNDWKYNTLGEIVDEYKLKTGNSVSGMDLYPQLSNSK